MAYGDLPPQQQSQLERPLTLEEQKLEKQRMMVEYFGRGGLDNRFTDVSTQVREAQYGEIDRLQDDEFVFDDWNKSRRLILARASRIPGIDTKFFKWLYRKFLYITARAHSEGKSNILRSMCETFDFTLELLVSKGDTPMTGLTGIGALITQNTNQKSEMKMPQEPQKIGFWPTGLLGGGSK